MIFGYQRVLGFGAQLLQEPMFYNSFCDFYFAVSVENLRICFARSDASLIALNCEQNASTSFSSAVKTGVLNCSTLLLISVCINTHNILTCCRCLDTSCCCSQHRMQCCTNLRAGEMPDNIDNSTAEEPRAGRGAPSVLFDEHCRQQHALRQRASSLDGWQRHWNDEQLRME
jgi:hypothetical protein